jgi:hypothetical protein
MSREHQFVLWKRGNRESKKPPAHWRIAAKSKNRGLVFRPDSLENLAVQLPDILPFDEFPEGFSDDRGTIQMRTGILAGKL